MSRLVTSHAENEPTPRNVFTDSQWIRLHEAELRDRYGECWIVVHQEQVLGTGDSYQTALADAERQLDASGPRLTVVVRPIYQRHPFLRVYPNVK